MLTLKAQIYFSMQMYEKAEAIYLNVLARKPQLVRVHRDLGQLYLLQSIPKKAQEHFSKAVSLGANEAIIHGQLAYLNLTLSSPFSAISEYQQAMALEPDELQWQQGLFTAFSQAKMYLTAQALLAEMLVKNPNDVDLWLNQAILLLNQNKNKQALMSLEMAIHLGNTDDSNLKTAAQLHLQLQSYDRAFELISKHVDQETLNTTTLNEYLTWLDQVEMWQEASSLLTKIAPKIKDLNASDQSLLFVQTANINNRRQRFKIAERYYKKALDMNPSNGNALLKYALFSNEQNAYIKSELLYIRAESLPEFEKQALLGKAQLYLNMQNHENALIQLQKAHAKYPELSALAQQIQAIKNIIRLKNKNSA
jgi:tetratricopeptide (TPR) repeat protein